jgi:hypothetical protein
LPAVTQTVRPLMSVQSATARSRRPTSIVCDR